MKPHSYQATSADDEVPTLEEVMDRAVIYPAKYPQFRFPDVANIRAVYDACIEDREGQETLLDLWYAQYTEKWYDYDLSKDDFRVVGAVTGGFRPLEMWVELWSSYAGELANVPDCVIRSVRFAMEDAAVEIHRRMAAVPAVLRTQFDTAVVVSGVGVRPLGRLLEIRPSTAHEHHHRAHENWRYRTERVPEAAS